MATGTIEGPGIAESGSSWWVGEQILILEATRSMRERKVSEVAAVIRSVLVR